MINLDIEKLAYEFQTTDISLTKMAKREHTTRQTLAKYFKNLGVEVVNKQNRTKFNENIFDIIDSEEKAYWLGFIFADGTIRSHKEGEKPIYAFEISLSEKDTNHLRKFNIFSEYNGDNVKISNSKCGEKTFLRCRWQVSNKHLWNTLNNYGCTPNKSLTLQFPNESIFKDKSLIIHFIRGYFDGDGCFTRYLDSKKVQPRLSIIGTKEFLLKCEEYIGINGTWSHDPRHTDKTFTIWFNVDNSIKLMNLLYQNSSIYLDRKYKLFEFFKNGSRSAQEWVELQSGNIGESPEKDNTEINSEIAKGSESSYSVEGE